MTADLISVQNNPHSLIAQAIDKGLDVNALEKLLELQQRWDADKARKSFFAAFTSFQANCPDLRKTKQVAFNQTSYHYAPLADITRQIGKALKENELSYRWEIKDTEKEIQVTCLISHIDGHTERTTMSAQADTSGAKNAIQARASTVTYMQRYTLIGALGLSTADSDIDGRLPQVDIDKLHADYMEVYNEVIQLDKTLTKFDPDNWKVERTAKAYVAAIPALKKKLAELKDKGK
jgi:hypothetical protein